MNTKKKPEVIATERVYDGRVFGLRDDTVRMPDGSTVRRQVVEHPGAVAVLAFEGEEVLLVEQYRHPAGEALLEVPAGTLEQGESPEACAARELEEETGFRAARLAPLGLLRPSPGICTEVIWLFEAAELAKTEARPEPDEELTLVRLPFDEALARAADGRITDGKTVACLFRAAARRGRVAGVAGGWRGGRSCPGS